MPRILVIDDEADARELLQQVLELAGHEVLLAANGARGLEMLRRSRADLVITDLFMPEKEGLETIRELQQHFPEVKIIAISGGGTLRKPGYLFTAGAAGALKLLQKPFDRDTLLKSVHEALG